MFECFQKHILIANSPQMVNIFLSLNCHFGDFFLRKTPVEDKSEVQATETKTPPAEVKTVPNEATQTNENESKA